MNIESNTLGTALPLCWTTSTPSCFLIAHYGVQRSHPNI